MTPGDQILGKLFYISIEVPIIIKIQNLLNKS